MNCSGYYTKNLTLKDFSDIIQHHPAGQHHPAVLYPTPLLSVFFKRPWLLALLILNISSHNIDIDIDIDINIASNSMTSISEIQMGLLLLWIGSFI